MCVSAAFGDVCGGVVYSATVSWGSLCVGWGILADERQETTVVHNHHSARDLGHF